MLPLKEGVGEHTLEMHGQLEPNILQLHFNFKFVCLMLWAELQHTKRCVEVSP